MLEAKDSNIINYHKVSLKTIESVKTHKIKPKLLLHACCGPCACYPIDWLHDIFDITIYYANSNIYPKEEYSRRYNELKEKVLPHYPEVHVIEHSYDNAGFTQLLSKYKDEPERGKRCWLCYELRLRQACEYAVTHHYDYVTTTLSVSRMKDSQVINQIGKMIIHDYPSLNYFYSDFKKNGGLEKGNHLAKVFDCYRQDYCGCIYSFIDKEKRNR